MEINIKLKTETQQGHVLSKAMFTHVIGMVQQDQHVQHSKRRRAVEAKAVEEDRGKIRLHCKCLKCELL